MISMHTSPLEQPGTGDAGGMNVYLLQVAKRLASLGVQTEIFTRATTRALPPLVEADPGVWVHHVSAGPYEDLEKRSLIGQVSAFARELLRNQSGQERGQYDLVHSHYWLSGQIGAMVKKHWRIPLVHTMHTMAKVKNTLLARGDRPEPEERIRGEESVVGAADRLIANTTEEAEQLTTLYQAEPADVQVVRPGVNLEVFRPRDRHAARRRLGVPEDAIVLTFAGRIQPLKGPDVLLRAVARLVSDHPELADRLLVPIIGGASGSGDYDPVGLAQRLGIGSMVRFVGPQPQTALARWMQASTLVAVPSYNESFGLVALEAQACGTPVVATATGGLKIAVADGVSGILVPGHAPTDWARAIEDLVSRPQLRTRLSIGARRHARQFGWSSTAEATLDVYRSLIDRA